MSVMCQSFIILIRETAFGTTIGLLLKSMERLKWRSLVFAMLRSTHAMISLSMVCLFHYDRFAYVV